MQLPSFLGVRGEGRVKVWVRVTGSVRGRVLIGGLGFDLGLGGLSLGSSRVRFTAR